MCMLLQSDSLMKFTNHQTLYIHQAIKQGNLRNISKVSHKNCMKHPACINTPAKLPQ